MIAKMDSGVLRSIPASPDGLIAIPPPKPVSDAARRAQAQVRDTLAARLGWAQTRKMQACEKIEGLKKQLADLALITAVNPKGMARLINHLAKQLAAAAGQYQEAGNPKDLQRLAASAEEYARSIGAGDDGLPVAEDATAADIRAVVTAATASDGDESFVKDVQTLRKRLEVLFEAAVRRAEKESEGKEKDLEELGELNADFAANDSLIVEAEDAISGWRSDPQPVNLVV